MNLRRRVMAVVTSTLIASGGVLAVASPAAAADSPTCKPTMILGIAGTEQGPEWSPGNPYGNEVKAAVERALGIAGGSEFAYAEPLDYPARLVSWRYPASNPVPYSYFESKDIGYAAAYAQLSEWANECALTQPEFVLIGYSQGAHIAGDLSATILRGEAAHLQGRLAGSLLMADPALNPDDAKVFTVNGELTGQGALLRRAEWEASDPVYSVCIVDDTVCDSRGYSDYGKTIHFKYADRSYAWSVSGGVAPPSGCETIASYFGALLAEERFPAPPGTETALGWGFGPGGQVGDGSTVNRATPVGLEGIGPVAQLAAGMNVGYALDDLGRVWAWGESGGGQLGKPADGSCSVPEIVQGLPEPIRSIGATGYGGYAVTSQGHVWAWGQDGQGQLGRGSLGSGAGKPVPARVRGLTNVVMTAGALYTGYALTAAGDVYSWGSNTSGQLGRGEIPSSGTASKIVGLPAMRHIASGGEVTIGVAVNGSVWTWGGCAGCALGNGQQLSYVPVQVPGLSSAVSAAANRTQGYDNFYVVLDDGTVSAWGPATGAGFASETPQQIMGLSFIVQIAAGDGSLYALTITGVLYSLGDNRFGQLGDGTTTSRPAPRVVEVGAPVTSIAAASWTAFGDLA